MCGSKVSETKDRNWWCDQCQHRFYDNPRPTADIVLFNDNDEVLLGKRADEPGKGKWDIPGGFVEFDESLEQSAERELLEELGLTASDYSNPEYVVSHAALYPWGDEVYHNVATWFVARIKSNVVLDPKDDITEAKFFSLDNLEEIDFSLPLLKSVVKDAAKKLKIKA